MSQNQHPPAGPASNDLRIEWLERDVADLRKELDRLKAMLDDLRSDFGSRLGRLERRVADPQCGCARGLA